MKRSRRRGLVVLLGALLITLGSWMDPHEPGEHDDYVSRPGTSPASGAEPLSLVSSRQLSPRLREYVLSSAALGAPVTVRVQLPSSYDDSPTARRARGLARSRAMTLSRHFTAARRADGLPWQVLAGGDRTDDQVVFGAARLDPRSSGPGLHVHTREDEAVYVTDGLLTVRVGDEAFEAGAGTLVWLPRGEPHTFANLRDKPVQAFGVITPAGLEGMFRETEAYLADLVGPPDPTDLGRIGQRYGVTALGPGLL